MNSELTVNGIVVHGAEAMFFENSLNFSSKLIDFDFEKIDQN